MQRDLAAYLWDIATAAEDIASYIHGRDFSDYVNESMFKAAVERKLITISEAFVYALRIDPTLTNAIPEVRDIIALRNRVAHGYMFIDDPTVWSIACNDLPGLREQVRRMLDEIGPPPFL